MAAAMGTNPYRKTQRHDVVSTPRCFYDDLNRHFAFDFDPTPLNPNFDGLVAPWGESNYINPPFSNIEPWLKRGIESGRQCVFLLPLRSNSRYWSTYVWPNVDALYFLMDGIQFVGYTRAWATPVVLALFNARNGVIPQLDTLGGLRIATMMPRRAHATRVDTSAPCSDSDVVAST